MNYLSDGGAIYTLGRQPGSTIRNNLIEEVKVYLDEGSCGWTVSGNLIDKVSSYPFMFHKPGLTRIDGAKQLHPTAPPNRVFGNRAIPTNKRLSQMVNLNGVRHHVKPGDYKEVTIVEWGKGNQALNKKQFVEAKKKWLADNPTVPALTKDGCQTGQKEAERVAANLPSQ